MGTGLCRRTNRGPIRSQKTAIEYTTFPSSRFEKVGVRSNVFWWLEIDEDIENRISTAQHMSRQVKVRNTICQKSLLRTKICRAGARAKTFNGLRNVLQNEYIPGPKTP